MKRAISPDQYHPPESKLRTRRDLSGASPFDDLALEYNVWFDGEGNLLFFIEGVRSGHFAQAPGR
jgi:hypothetical protein